MESVKRVGVLVGGLSGERDLSVRTGEAVRAALAERGHIANLVFVDRDVDLALRQAEIDVALVALRGRYGGDGCLQGLLELLGIPYTGSGVLASSLAMNRGKTKEVLRLHNLPTSPGYVFTVDSPTRLAETHGSFGYPAMVRPVGAAAGGFAVAQDDLELEAAVDDAFRLDEEVLIERFVPGRRVCVGVLEGESIGAIELTGGAIGPAAFGLRGTARYRSLLRLAAAAYEVLGCEGPACVEMVVSGRVNEVIVEVDSHPLLLPTAPLPVMARAAGIEYPTLLEDILSGARLRAHRHRQNRRALQVSFHGHDRRASAAGTAH